MSEKLKTLADELDIATGIINSELQIVSSKISTEFTQLINTLSNELDQITVKVTTSPSTNVSPVVTIDNKINLTEAVQSAGLTAK